MPFQALCRCLGPAPVRHIHIAHKRKQSKLNNIAQCLCLSLYSFLTKSIHTQINRFTSSTHLHFGHLWVLHFRDSKKTKTRKKLFEPCTIFFSFLNHGAWFPVGSDWGKHSKQTDDAKSRRNECCRCCCPLFGALEFTPQNASAACN
jgi:hypothetical protein